MLLRFVEKTSVSDLQEAKSENRIKEKLIIRLSSVLLLLWLRHELSEPESNLDREVGTVTDICTKSVEN